MTFHGIAYGPLEHVLVTFDGSDLLAYDAQTEAPKWQATLATAAPIVAIAFADAGALPAAEGGSPWREAAPAHTVVALDAEGGIHVVEPLQGRVVGRVAPLGKPVAFAAGAGGRLVVATADRLFLWRAGERTELPARASALAFSRDGGTLAIGELDGSLRFLSVAGSGAPTETFCAVVHGGVSDLTQHPGGAWLAVGKLGLTTITENGPRRLDGAPANLTRVALDTLGRRLAVQLSDRAAAVYAWPSLNVELRIEYVERPVRGLSFGPENWLGVALDHGDGNKIDVLTSATHRTDTHPGRTHRGWLLSVRGKESILSAREAEDIRRMKEPFHVAPAPKEGKGRRIGVGVGLSVAVLCLRLFALGARSTHSSPSFDPNKLNLGTYAPTLDKCDRACAKARIELLQSSCGGDTTCTQHVTDAEEALSAGNCAEAKRLLAQFPIAGDGVRKILLERAKAGLEQSCTVAARPPRQPQLVHLGATGETTIEKIPPTRATEGEEPTSVWSAPDGTVFVSTMTESHRTGVVHRRDKTGAWSVMATRRTTSPVQLWGRSATDLYLMDGDSVAYWDGRKRTEIEPPSSVVTGLGGIGDDVFVAGEATTTGDAGVPASLHHRRTSAGTTAPWTADAVTDGLTVRELWSGGGTLWARAIAAENEDGIDDRLLQRVNGRWTERKWFGATRPPTVVIHAVWVGPTGDVFVVANAGLHRSSGGGATWSQIPSAADVSTVWGRTSRDVYVGTSGGVMHYDGKDLSATAYTGLASGLGGTASELLIVRSSSSTSSTGSDEDD